jgi:uncharacterized repeat protein (TIGR01451 family)
MSNQNMLRRMLRSSALLSPIILVLALFSFIIIERASAQAQVGQKDIAFDFNGQIYVVAADGSNQVLVGDGVDPTWSPNGNKIAYASIDDPLNSDIYVMNADGSNPVRLTQNLKSSAPAWSPDGTKIAFTNYQSGNPEIYTMNPDGSNQQRVTTSTGFYYMGSPTWSPDGMKLAFAGIESELSDPELYVTNADGSGATTRLTYNIVGISPVTPPSWSPDGQRIALGINDDLFAVNVDGSGIVQLTNSADVNESVAAYSADGKRIAYIIAGDLLELMNSDGTYLASLGVNGNNPAWNPAVVQPSPSPSPSPDPSPSPTPDPSPSPTPAPGGPADIVVGMRTSDDTARVGDQVKFFISVRNDGPGTATNVNVVSEQPPYLDLLSVDTTKGTCTPGKRITCQIDSLSPREGVTITLTTRANRTGLIGHGALAHAAEKDPRPFNNFDWAKVRVLDACATETRGIAISVQRTNETADYTEFDITLRNATGRDLSPRNVLVLDHLNHNVSIASPAVSGFTECARPLGNPYILAIAPNGVWARQEVIRTKVVLKHIGPHGNTSFGLRIFNGYDNP